MKLQKQALLKMSEEAPPFVDATPAERVSMIWDLTAEVWSLTDPQGVERRLQRDVAKLIRPRAEKVLAQSEKNIDSETEEA